MISNIQFFHNPTTIFGSLLHFYCLTITGFWVIHSNFLEILEISKNFMPTYVSKVCTSFLHAFIFYAFVVEVLNLRNSESHIEALISMIWFLGPIPYHTYLNLSFLYLVSQPIWGGALTDIHHGFRAFCYEIQGNPFQGSMYITWFSL